MHAIKILESTTTKHSNRYSVGLLCKEEVFSLHGNRNMTIFRILSLERKFEKSPSLKVKYAETTNHTSTLPESMPTNILKPITSYIPHQAVTNVYKHGKFRVVFNVGTYHQNTSLLMNIYKREHTF